MTPTTFAELELAPELLKSLDRLGLETPTHAQITALRAARESQSTLLLAPAASGGSLAVALTAADRVTPGGKRVQVVILTPTRESVLHLTESLRTVGSGRKACRVAPLFQGQSEARQAALSDSGPTVVVATPATLRLAVEAGRFALGAVTLLLVDSLDDLLETGQGDETEAILTAVPEGVVVVALAHLLGREVEGFLLRRVPGAVRVVPPPAPAAPPLMWFDVAPAEKLAALTVLADRHVVERGVVFVNSRVTAESLAEQLSAAGYPAEAVTGADSTTARDKVAKKFRQGGLSFVVSTDAGVEGLELEPADIVVSVDWPVDDTAFTARQMRLRPGGAGFALAAGRELIRARAFSRRGGAARLGRLPLLGELAEARLHAQVGRLREALAGRNPAACRTMVDILVAEGFEPAVIAGAAIRLLGQPELPPPPVLAPLPVPPPVIRRERPTPAPVPEPVTEYTETVEAVEQGGEAPVEDGGDWSPGVATGSGAYEETDDTIPEGAGTVMGEDGVQLVEGDDSGYIYTDNAAEDGVVYPPEANFGGEETTVPGYPEERGGRRGRRGRGGASGGGGNGGGRGGRPGDDPSPAGMRKIWLNVGRMDRIQPRDIVGCILGETGHPSATVGRVQLFERHTLVDVSSAFENEIIEALNRTAIRGRKLRAKLAQY